MRKRLFIISVLSISFGVEYLVIAGMFYNMDFTFGAGVSPEGLLFDLLPIVTMIVIAIVAGICGKRIFKDWRRKDQIMTIVTPIISTVVAFAIFIALHP